MPMGHHPGGRKPAQQRTIALQQAPLVYSMASSTVSRNSREIASPSALGGLEVDDQFEFGWELHRQVRQRPI
jgi:hypothetical protein